MSDNRVNIKADKTTRDRLRGLKRDGETWDGLLLRLAEIASSDPNNCQAPDCDNEALTWLYCDDGHSQYWTAVCQECHDTLAVDSGFDLLTERQFTPTRDC
jgi:hypothetical protein